MFSIINAFQISALVFIALYSLLRRWDAWIIRHLQLIALKYSNYTGRWQISIKDVVILLLFMGVNIGLILR